MDNTLRNQRACGMIVALLICALPGRAEPQRVTGPKPHAAPPAPPIQQIQAPPSTGGDKPKPMGIILYSIGQPTDEEQLYLEYLNRMRANPTAEGQRLAVTTDLNVLSAYSSFGVDLNLMQSEFATNPAVPPLAMNAKLMAAARWHSQDMFTYQYQGHFQTNGTIVMNPGDRIATNGYQAQTWGENVYSYADSVFHGHAGFAVDWGPGIGGMQNPPGHRNNMLSGLFREVGVGVVDGVNGSVGPQLVTQDLGTQIGATPYITGVVYFDLNGNGFYDLGEGIGGVTVNTPGSSYFTVTADSGGYALPVPANGNYTLTFTANGLSNQFVVTISSLQNKKIDLVPQYSPPTLSGPNPALLNQNNTYSFAAIPAATNYQWAQAQVTPYTTVEGAENGVVNVTAVTSPGYPVVSSDLAASGQYSFNLEHTSPVDQTITLNPALFVTANSQLSFAKYLTYVTSDEVAEAQVSSDAGQTWQTVWSQAGNDSGLSVDSGFSTQTISLAAYAGQTIQVRFVYAFSSGSYYNVGSPLGVYFDDIAVSQASQLGALVTNNINSGTSFTFVPMELTNYLLMARANVNGRTLPWGPATTVNVTQATASPSVQVTSSPVVSGSQVQIDFNVSNFQPGMSFQLMKASSLGSGWSVDASASLQTLVPNAKFRFTTPAAGAAEFFRVKGS